MAPPSLLGPPELYAQTQVPVTESQPMTGDPFVDLLVANFNKTQAVHEPPMGWTENASATYLSSGNSCLDFFFHVVPDTPPESLKERLQLAWEHDALTTLKLICNLRGVRGTGKSDKEGFHTAAFWLHKHHPRTLACNVAAFAEFGYFKDLPEILYRILEGPEVRRNQREEWEQRKRGTRRISFRGRFGKPKSKRENKSKHIEPKEVRIAKAGERSKSDKERASAARKERKINMAKKVVDRYTVDIDFRFLYERISDLFAECLKNDMKSLNSGE